MLKRMLFTFPILFLIFATSKGNAMPGENRVAITVPKAPWMLSLTSEGLILEGQKIQLDGRNGYFFLSGKNNIVVSLFIEPVNKCNDSKACRDLIWKLGNPAWKNLQDVKQSEMEDISVLEFLLPSFQGQPVQQQNLYAEFVVDGFWVDMHISKTQYHSQEHEIFERLVKSVKFTNKKAESQPKQ